VDNFQGRRSSPETPRSEHHHTVRIFRYGVFPLWLGPPAGRGQVDNDESRGASSGDTRFKR
jgi:hypothetical protein